MSSRDRQGIDGWTLPHERWQALASPHAKAHALYWPSCPAADFLSRPGPSAAVKHFPVFMALLRGRSLFYLAPTLSLLTLGFIVVSSNQLYWEHTGAADTSHALIAGCPPPPRAIPAATISNARLHRPGLVGAPRCATGGRVSVSSACSARGRQRKIDPSGPVCSRRSLELRLRVLQCRFVGVGLDGIVDRLVKKVAHQAVQLPLLM